MAKAGKKYEKASKLVDRATAYHPQEAIKLAKQAAYAQFDETVELHLRMGLDPRHADQQVRGTVLLPHGLGKKVRILVFSQGEAARIAQEAGADYVGADDLAKKIEEGWLDFDVAMATPDMMSRVGRLGKILGRRGLMPNPKAGTVVQPGDLPRVIKEARQGRVEFKMDKTGIIHLALGKTSFDEAKLAENLAMIMDAINKARPSGAKGLYIRAAYLATTMGPGIKLDLKAATALSAA